MKGGFLAGFAVLLVLLPYFFVVRPVGRSYDGSPKQVSALVVLAGSNGDRVDHALAMADAGVSNVLVFNTGVDWVGPGAARVESLCRDGYREYAVHCVAALPDSTKGEAQTISRLASELGFESLGVVTSEFHMHRATRWFDRCSESEIVPVPVPETAGGIRSRNELVSSAHSLLIDRSCHR